MNESEKSEVYTIFMVSDIYQPIFCYLCGKCQSFIDSNNNYNKSSNRIKQENIRNINYIYGYKQLTNRFFVLYRENTKLHPWQFLVALNHLDKKYLVSYLTCKNQRYRGFLEYFFLLIIALQDFCLRDGVEIDIHKLYTIN